MVVVWSLCGFRISCNKACNSYRIERNYSHFFYCYEIIPLSNKGIFMRTIITLICLLGLSNAYADTLIFKIKKSYNPKNVLNYSVVTNSKCELEQKNKTYIIPLWYMGENGGGTEGLTSTEKTYYLPKEGYINQQNTELDFTLGAMDKLKAYIPDPTITVRTQVIDGKCIPEALMTIDNEEITLVQVYISGHMTWSLEWKMDYLTISGFSADGKPFSKKIQVSK